MHPEGADLAYLANVRRAPIFVLRGPPRIRKRAAPKPNPPVHTYRTCIDPWAVTRFPRRNATQAFLVPFSYRPLGRATLIAPLVSLQVERSPTRSSSILDLPPPTSAVPFSPMDGNRFRGGSLARLDPSGLYTLFMRRIFLRAPKLSTAAMISVNEDR